MTDYEIEEKNISEGGQFKKRIIDGNVPQHLIEMEEILNRATKKMDELESVIAEYEQFQSEIQKLEAYYTSEQWKDDFAMDERGELPEKTGRGILSEDGIYNLLERNKELLEKIQS